MATVIDISNKIKNEQKFIVYNGKNYKVDDSYPTVMEAQGILANANGNDLEAVNGAMIKLLGKDAVKDFEGLCMQDYLVPFYAAMACVNGKSYEETEAMFRNAAKTE